MRRRLPCHPPTARPPSGGCMPGHALPRAPAGGQRPVEATLPGGRSAAEARTRPGGGRRPRPPPELPPPPSVALTPWRVRAGVAGRRRRAPEAGAEAAPAAQRYCWRGPRGRPRGNAANPAPGHQLPGDNTCAGGRRPAARSPPQRPNCRSRSSGC
jgi:hypothetical protein